MTGLPARFALALLATVVTLGAIEVTLRALGTEDDYGLRGLHEARPDRAWLYGLRPGARRDLADPRPVTYRINRAGFRDRDHLEKRPDSSFRIVVLGDSLTFGYGVDADEGFPARLESIAAERAPTAHIEVMNLGVGGYNPYNEAALIEDIGPALAPDLVLVQFCINDLNDPTLHFDGNTRLALGEIPAAAFPDPTARVEAGEPSTTTALCAQSRLCELVGRRLAGDAAAERAAWEAAFAPRGGDAEREWRWLADQYARIHTAARELGASMVVLGFPFPAQLESQDEGGVQARLVSIGEAGGWRTVDLRQAFEESDRASAEPLFFDLWHPTARGHQLAAEHVFDSLVCANVLPVEPEPACAPASGARSTGR